jgi:hypothetical protein
MFLAVPPNHTFIISYVFLLMIYSYLLCKMSISFLWWWVSWHSPLFHLTQPNCYTILRHWHSFPKLLKEMTCQINLSFNSSPTSFLVFSKIINLAIFASFFLQWFMHVHKIFLGLVQCLFYLKSFAKSLPIISSYYP